MDPVPLAARSVRCPRCKKDLPPPDAPGANGEEACPYCRRTLIVRRFAALAVPAESLVAPAEVAQSGEGSCFFHPEKKATLSCEQCGRFVCSLCDMPMGSRHLCPSCVEIGLSTQKVPELVNRRVSWGGVALALGWVPVVMAILWPFYVVSGPAAIFAGIYIFRKPGSVVRGKRPVAAVFGIIGGLVQLAALGGLAFVFTYYRDR